MFNYLPKFTTLFFTFLFLVTSGLAQDNQTADKDSLDLYDKVIMERITVVGTPVWMNNIPGAANYIGTKELEKHNYTDINRVLRGVSGVNIQEEDGFGLRPNIGLRGSGVERSSKITLMEDGVLIAPAPYSAPAAYYIPSMGRMSSIEVRKGSSQIKYGPNTTGGAINMISTPIPYELKGQAEVSLGEHNTRKLYANIGNTHKNIGYLIETLQMRNDGFKELDFGGNTGFDVKDFMGKLMFRTDPDASIFQKAELKFGYYDEISNETYLGLTDSDFSSNPVRRYAASAEDEMNAEHLQYQILHFARFSSNIDLTTTIYRNEFQRNWYKLDKVAGTGISSILSNPQLYSTRMNVIRGDDSNPGDLDVKANNREYLSQGVQTILGINFESGDMKNQIEFGFRYHQDEMDRFQWVNNYQMLNNQMILSSAGTPGTESNRIESANSLAIYLQDKIYYKDWTITPGIRFEHINLKRENFGENDPDRTRIDLSVTENTVNVFVPGIGIVYQATDNLSLITGIHKGFAPPGTGAQTDTDSEQSINYELGTRYEKGHIQGEMIGFFNNYSNLLGSDLAAGGGTGTTRQFNAGEVHVAGLEFTYNMDIAEFFEMETSLPLSMNYTYTHGTFQNTFISDFGAWGDVEKGFELPYLPKNQFNVSFGYLREQFGVNLNAYGTSRMRTVAGDGHIQAEESTDSYLLLDISARYNLNTRTEFFINFRNITDQAYIVSRRPAGVRPGLPRTFMGGLKVSI